MTVSVLDSDHNGKHAAQHTGMTSQCKVRKSRVGMQAQTCPAVAETQEE